VSTAFPPRFAFSLARTTSASKLTCNVNLAAVEKAFSRFHETNANTLVADPANSMQNSVNLLNCKRWLNAASRVRDRTFRKACKLLANRGGISTTSRAELRKSPLSADESSPTIRISLLRDYEPPTIVCANPCEQVDESQGRTTKSRSLRKGEQADLRRLLKSRTSKIDTRSHDFTISLSFYQSSLQSLGSRVVMILRTCVLYHGKLLCDALQTFPICMRICGIVPRLVASVVDGGCSG